MLRASVLTLVVPTAVFLTIAVPTSVLAQRAEGWSGLGIVVVGLGAAIALGVVALVVTAAVAFGRALPRGQRWRPALAAVVGPLAALVMTTGPLAWGGPGTKLCLAGLTVLLPLAVTGHARWRWAVVVAVAAVALGFVDGGATQWGRDQDRRAELERFEGALPLTDGRSLDSPLPGGWVYLDTDVPYPGSDLPLGMQWRRGANTPDEDNYSITVATEPTDCTPFGDDPACTVVGQGVHGEITRHYSGYVFVRVGEVEWRVESYGLDDADATAVLDSLEPVDVATFLRVAESTIDQF